MPPTNGTPSITANGIIRAVDTVSLSAEKVKNPAVIGEFGCGKSTIARSIVRLLTPTSGRILVDGTDIAQISEKSLRLKGGQSQAERVGLRGSALHRRPNEFSGRVSTNTSE